MAEPQGQRVGWWWLPGLAVGVLAVAAHWLLFTTFMVYDDEGYVLLSLRQYADGGALYDQVFSQYGPFLYVFYDGLHRLAGFDFTNHAARWITLANWLAISGAGAVLVARASRSLAWSGFSLVLTFAYLWVMINEPVHPGGTLAAIVALSAWLGAELWQAGRIRTFAVLAGLAGAALACTKINVGAFFLCSAAWWLALNSARPRWARGAGWLLAAGCAALPFVLMRGLIDSPWVRLFGLIFICTSLGTLLATARFSERRVTAGAWLWFAGAALAGSALFCALAVAHGTRLSSLLDGMVLGPLRHPGVYSFGVRWRPGAGLLALASLGLAAWIAARDRWTDLRWRQAIAWTRFGAAAVFLAAAFQLVPTPVAAWGMSYGVSLAWLFAAPLAPRGRWSFTGLWLAGLLVFQCLQAYPVAGSQLNWGTFLWVPLLAWGVQDAAAALRAEAPRVGAWAARAGAAAAVAAALYVGGKLSWIGWQRYSTSQPLGLAGAENLRLPDDLTYAFRITAENARAHGDLLFSYPGSFSTNLWTGLPTPTGANATHWFSLLTPAQQQAIIDRLANAKHPVIWVQRYHLDYLRDHGFSTASPLQAWILAHFEPALSLEMCELWVRRGRSIALLSTARLEAATEAHGAELRLTLEAPSQPIAAVALVDVDRPRDLLLTLAGAGTAAAVQSIAEDGTPAGPREERVFPLALGGRVELALQLPPDAAARVGARSLLVAFGRDGSRVAELRLLGSAAVRRLPTTNTVSANR